MSLCRRYREAAKIPSLLAMILGGRGLCHRDFFEWNDGRKLDFFRNRGEKLLGEVRLELVTVLPVIKTRPGPYHCVLMEV